MQLVVPPGQEWNFRDPGTGAFQAQAGTQRPGAYQPDATQVDSFRPGGYQPGARQPERGQQDPFGPPGAAGLDSGPGYQGSASFDGPPGLRGGTGFDGPQGPATQQPGGMPAATAARPTRRRRAPLLIGAGAVVAVVAIGAAVAVPRVLGKHTDPGCSAYASSALPAYNQAVTDLNAQASQATLTSDLAAAISQLTSAVGQARDPAAKTALDNLLVSLNTVQAGVRKGSVPASMVSALNSASATADNAC
jgi:hypothetical protein